MQRCNTQAGFYPKSSSKHVRLAPSISEYLDKQYKITYMNLKLITHKYILPAFTVKYLALNVLVKFKKYAKRIFSDT